MGFCKRFECIKKNISGFEILKNIFEGLICCVCDINLRKFTLHKTKNTRYFCKYIERLHIQNMLQKFNAF